MVLSVESLLSEADKKIYQFINAEYKPSIILVNKWDLIEEKTTLTHNDIIKKIKNKLPMISHVQFIFISAKTGHNISKIFNALIEINKNYNQKLQTSKFNDFVQNIINRHSPPQAGGNIKLYYGTQVGTAPPKFNFYTNKPEKIGANYKNFLINRLRENFSFSGCPIILKFRKK